MLAREGPPRKNCSVYSRPRTDVISLASKTFDGRNESDILHALLLEKQSLGDGDEGMAESPESFRRKVRAIFSEMAGERAPKLATNGAQDLIAAALSDELGFERAADVGFHLSDWGEDAAFLVAVHLFPERFTVEEIRDGVTALLIHAPNHIAAGAHIAGWPLRDVFEVGLKLDN